MIGSFSVDISWQLHKLVVHFKHLGIYPVQSPIPVVLWELCMGRGRRAAIQALCLSAVGLNDGTRLLGWKF